MQRFNTVRSEQPERAQPYLSLPPSPTHSTMPSAPPTIVTGTVKWFSVPRGFGFITLQDGTDIFFHVREIKQKISRNHALMLAEGELLACTIVDTPKGPEAANVTGPGGAPLKTKLQPRKEDKPAEHRPKQLDTPYTTLDVVIRTAVVLSNGDPISLQTILPAILKANGLPVIQLPSSIPLTKERPPRPSQKPRSAPRKRLALKEPLNRRNCEATNILATDEQPEDAPEAEEMEHTVEDTSSEEEEADEDDPAHPRWVTE